MIKTLAVNADNDIYLNSSGNIAVNYDLNAIVDECSQAARTLLGECVFNINVGLPYFQTVFKETTSIQQFTAALRRAILSINGVIEIVELAIWQDSITDINNLNYQITIKTIFGTGVVNG